MFVCGKALDLDTVPTPEQVTLARLEDQIRWYDRRSAHSQTRFKWMKGTTIASAAIIPLLTAARVPHSAEMAAALGVLIGIIEGVQQLNQYQSNWMTFRSTSEALKREKYLYLAKAGSYADAQRPGTLLAERIEGLVSQETARWFTAQSAAFERQDSRAQPQPR